jgi:hypothetical protein
MRSPVRTGLATAPVPMTRQQASYVRAATLCCRRSQTGREIMPKNPTNEARQAGADKRAADLAPIVKELHAAGVTSLRAIAAALDERGIPTATGGRWHHSQVRRLLARLPA